MISARKEIRQALKIRRLQWKKRFRSDGRLEGFDAEYAGYQFNLHLTPETPERPAIWRWGVIKLSDILDLRAMDIDSATFYEGHTPDLAEAFEACEYHECLNE